MCGIAGFYRHQGLDEDPTRTVLRAMTAALQHRGPDGDGEFIDADAGIALGHRRLAVVDLSAAGRQPMASRSGRYVLVLNGEIYNHAEIRSRLGDDCWRGHSDTEVLAEAIERWGLEAALESSHGMFALVLWDSIERAVFLCRDRMGEKPLYFGKQGDVWLFGSELRALERHPSFERRLNVDVVPSFLKHGCIPGSSSIWHGIGRVQPGEVVVLKGSAVASRYLYWSLPRLISRRGGRPRRGRDDREEILEASEILRSVLRRQMTADVPVGALLSGGIDSSVVVGALRQVSSATIQTFSIGFEDPLLNELPYASAVARHFDTNHTEVTLTASDALNAAMKMGEIYDEPFGDSSQIPTFVVAGLARRSVTVALSGDGGDESFGGYSRYATIGSRLAFARRVSSVGSLCHRDLLQKLANAQQVPGALRKLARLGMARNDTERYRELVAQTRERVCVGRGDHSLTAASNPDEYGELDAISFAMLRDTTGYLPDDILTKVDRASMAVSLEVRSPLLDHSIVEFAWSLPTDAIVRAGRLKWLLSAVLEQWLPRALIERPKRGFSIPVSSWLRSEFRTWVADLLATDDLRRGGVFDAAVVTRVLNEHLTGRQDHGALLWNLAMFQSWQNGVRARGSRP